MQKLYLITLICCLTTPSFSEFYKWVDTQGNVYYGEKPPTDVISQKIESNTLISVPPPPNQEIFRQMNQNSDAQKAFSKRKSERQAKSLAKETEISQRCFQLRQQLKKLQLQVPIYTTDPTGKRHYLSDEQRIKEISLNQAILKTHCS